MRGGHSGGTTSGLRRWGAWGSVLVVAVMLTACAGSSRDSTTSAGPSEQALPASPQGAAAADTAAGVDAQGASFKVDALNQTPAESGRSFISTATMTVQVDDVSAAKPKVIALVEAAGGSLFAEQTSYGASAKSVLTLKVPPAQFSKTLDAIAGVGAMSKQEVKTDDVTQQVVDLDARILAATDSLERTRALLAGAKSLGEITQLETEVERRQGDLESLKGQAKTLKGKVDLATIVATLDGDQATPAVVKAGTPAPPADLPGFLDGLEGGLGVAATVGTVGLAVLGASLPFLPILLLGWFGVRWARRRRRTDVPETAAA